MTEDAGSDARFGASSGGAGASGQGARPDAYRLFVQGRGACDPARADRMAGKMRDGGFSWLTLLVGPLYFLYRKLYAPGIVWLCANVVVSLFPDGLLSTVLSAASLLASVVLGLAFYPLYRRKADAAASAAQLHGNDGAAWEASVRAAGGTAARAVVAGVLAIVLVSVVEVFGGAALYHASPEGARLDDLRARYPYVEEPVQLGMGEDAYVSDDIYLADVTKDSLLTLIGRQTAAFEICVAWCEMGADMPASGTWSPKDKPRFERKIERLGDLEARVRSLFASDTDALEEAYLEALDIICSR